MGFWLTLFLYVGFTVLGELLRPKARFEKPQPSSLGDFRLPTATEGRAIPAVFGTCKVMGPNVVWYGDLLVAAIKTKVKTGLFSSDNITTGYKYSLGQQLVICHGEIDDLNEIRFDDRPVPTGRVVIPSPGDIVFYEYNGSPKYTTTIPAGEYATGDAFAAAVAQALNLTLYPLGNTKIFQAIYGWFATVNRSDHLGTVYVYESSMVIAYSFEWRITPRAYAMAFELVNELESSFNDLAEAARIAAGKSTATRVVLSVSATASSPVPDRYKFVLTMARGAGGSAYSVLWDRLYYTGPGQYDVSGVPMIGFPMGGLYTWAFSTPASLTLTSSFWTHPRRMILANSGGGMKLMCDDPGFTAADALGFSTAINRGQWGANTDGIQFGNALADSDFDPLFSYGNTIVEDEEKWRVSVNAPYFFGGEEREGGIVGDFDVYKGTLTQTPNDYLEATLGVDLPAYRGISYAVARRPYLGLSPYLKAISFVVRRNPNGLALTGSMERIGDDANPACAIYEILTNTRWGLGIDAGLIDTTSFVDVAETVYGEGLGISIVVDAQAQAADVIEEILRHVDGVLFTDPATGKITFKLAREDYELGDLITLDNSNCTVETFSRPSWSETRNVVKAHYIDRAANYTERIAQVQDLANLQARGGEQAVEDIDFRGFTTAAAATIGASRSLRVLSYPLAAIQLVANRIASGLRPGDVFKFTHPALGISEMVCRVTRISPGQLEDGKVRIDATEDIFGIAWTSYSPPTTEWEDPVSGDLQAPALEQMIEAPYALVDGPDRHVITLASRATGDVSLGYQVWSDTAGGTAYVYTREVPGFTPAATLETAIGYTDTTIVVENGVEFDDLPTGWKLLLIDDELIAFQTITDNEDGTYTITGAVRGVIDTMPAQHAQAAGIWCLAFYGSTATDPYSADLTLTAIFRPYTANDLYGGASDQLSITTVSRAARPYPPRDVLLNDEAYPAGIEGELTVEWGHRDRLSAWLYDDGGLTAAPETGCTYTLRLYGDDGLLKRTVTDLTGTSYTWTTEEADSGGKLNTEVRVVLETVAADETTTSFQDYDYTVPRTGGGGGEFGFGSSWGDSWGD